MLIVGGICTAVLGAGNLTAHATLGYYAEFEFINDNYVKRARQTISQARYYSINVGDCYLGFHRQNRLNQIHVLFDIPVIDTSETTLTILYK